MNRPANRDVKLTMNNSNTSSLFNRLKTGLEECIQHSRGELNLKTVPCPEEPPLIDAATIVELRKRANMSQAVFAMMLNISSRTLQSWEQGVRQPSDASRRLLQIFSTHPEVLCRSAGLPEVRLDGVVIRKPKNGPAKIVVTKLRKTAPPA